MGHTTVRIDDATRATLRALARAEQRSMREVLEGAVEQYRRQRFLEAVNMAYGELRRDTPAWRELEAERDAWDATIGDGLGIAGPPPARGAVGGRAARARRK